MLFGRLFARALLPLAILSSASSARADDLQVCSDAYTKAQEERLAGHSFSARSQLQVCAQSMCPATVVHDCTQWLTEVEATLPTILVSAKDSSGRPVPGVQVYLDGVTVAARQLTQPIVLDAGAHNLRFEAQGYESVQLNPFLRAGDRNLQVSAALQPNHPAAPTPSSEPAPPPARTGHPVPAATIVLAAVGTVALGGAVYFGLSASSQYNDLKSACDPHCSQSQADSVHKKALITDIALATSVVAFGAAAWIYFSAESEPAHSGATALGFAPTPDGARAQLRVTF